MWYEMHLVAAGPRRDRRDDSRRAVRRARPQRAHRVGHDRDRRRRAGPRASSASTSAKKRSMYRGEWVPIETISGRHSGARAQRAVPVRSVEDAQRRRSSPTTISIGKRRRRGCRPTIVRPKSAAPIRSAGMSTAISRPRSKRSTAPATGRRSPTRSQAFAVAVDEHRLRRRRRQHRLRDVGPAAGARVRRRHHAGRRQLGAGVDRHRSSRPRCRASFNPPSGLIYSANNEIDRSFSGLITRDWTARFPRLAPARSAVEGGRRRPRRDGGAAERSTQPRGGSRSWPALDEAIKTGAIAEGEAGIGVDARAAREVGSRGRLRGRSSRSMRRSRTRCGGARSSTRWTSRCS